MPKWREYLSRINHMLPTHTTRNTHKKCQHRIRQRSKNTSHLPHWLQVLFLPLNLHCERLVKKGSRRHRQIKLNNVKAQNKAFKVCAIEVTKVLKAITLGGSNSGLISWLSFWSEKIHGFFPQENFWKKSSVTFCSLPIAAKAASFLLVHNFKYFYYELSILEQKLKGARWRSGKYGPAVLPLPPSSVEWCGRSWDHWRCFDHPSAVAEMEVAIISTSDARTTVISR